MLKHSNYQFSFYVQCLYIHIILIRNMFFKVIIFKGPKSNNYIHNYVHKAETVS